MPLACVLFSWIKILKALRSYLLSFLSHAKERPLKLALIKSCPTERTEMSKVHLFCLIIIIAFLDVFSMFKWSLFSEKNIFIIREKDYHLNAIFIEYCDRIKSKFQFYISKIASTIKRNCMKAITIDLILLDY